MPLICSLTTTKRVDGSGHAEMSTQASSCAEELLKVFTKLVFRNRSDGVVAHVAVVLPDLCNAPLKFFTQDRLKFCLFPALIACCFESSDNFSRLRKELSPSQLSSFVAKISQLPVDSEQRKQLAALLPEECWQDILTQFRTG